jgi:hypothetical protein
MQADRLAMPLEPKRRQIALLVAAEGDNLHWLPAFEKRDLDRIAGFDLEYCRAATFDDIAFYAGLE